MNQPARISFEDQGLVLTIHKNNILHRNLFSKKSALNMNFAFLLFFSALTCAVAAKAGKTHIVHDDVEANFQVNSQIQPDENANNDDFVSQCIASSFNTVHAKTDYQFDSVDLQSENLGPGVGLSAAELGRKFHLVCIM